MIFRDAGLAPDFKFVRKQGTHLASKMRFISAQFEALLSNDLWLRNASHANRMARLLESQVRAVPGVKITRPVQANAVFAVLPAEVIETLQKEAFFYVFDERISEVRWMTSFDTEEPDITEFVGRLKAAVRA